MATNVSQNTAQTIQNTQAIKNNAAQLKAQSMAAAQATRDTVAFADASGRGRITLENFGRTFDSATRKVLVWQVAIAAVYGVMRKTQETIQTWKDLELTLARISVTTGAVGKDLENYFRQVADIAVEFGMPLEKTLEGMDLALRATASLGDGAERTATSVRLLKDASILANLTGMQYSQSMDILVGALRQTGMGLDEGIKLLDKWVAVSKNAAVSVSDLSQGFAIMADAAEAAGLSVDQVNGLIAALSEKVTLGPTEIGNAVRSLMSTLYNEGSITALRKYGIAVENTAGEARGFWDIMSQLSSVRVSGVLDDSAWLDIARAAGGGSRRYAQFLALLDSMPTATRIANISTSAQGQALAANEKIVDTLTNTWDKFTATQKKLFMEFGSQTNAIKDLTGVLSTLTSWMNKLANAAPGVWDLARAVGFLVTTMTTLKVLTAAIGWLGVTSQVGGLLGSFAGIPAAKVAGTKASNQAMAYLSATSGSKRAFEKAVMSQRIGSIDPNVASSIGMLGLSGLLPSGMRNKMMSSAMGGATWNAKTNRWMGYNDKGRYGFVPTPTVGGSQVQMMTWGKVGRALTTGTPGAVAYNPLTWGRGSAFAGIGGAAATYGLTQDWIASTGAGIGSAAGAALGGPVGMAAGALIGGVIGKAISEATVSSTKRFKDTWKDIANEFSINVEEVLKNATININPEDTVEDIVKKFTEISKAAAEYAPKMPELKYAESRPWYERLGATDWVQWSNPLGKLIDDMTGRTPKVAGYEPIEGAKEWKTGLGALGNVDELFRNGAISADQYKKSVASDSEAINSLVDDLIKGTISVDDFKEASKKAGADTVVAWGSMDSSMIAYIEALGLAKQGSEEFQELSQRILSGIAEQVAQRQALTKIENRYADSQKRITDIMEKENLGAWESTNIQILLSKQLKMTDEDFQKQMDAILGSSYAYASYMDSIRSLGPLLESMGVSLDTISPEKWLLIQQWDTNLAGNILDSTTELTTLINTIDTFKTRDFPNLIKLLPGQADATLNDLASIREEALKLSESTSNDELAKKLQDYIALIDQYNTNLLLQGQIGTKIGAYNKMGTTFQPRGEVRLVDEETLAAYRKSKYMAGPGGTYTALAESLGEFDSSIITLVSPLNNQTERLEGNTLALEMLANYVSENTEALNKKLEVEYNLPGWYQKPTRYWAMKTLQDRGELTEFGPAQEGLWKDWIEFLANRGKEVDTAINTALTESSTGAIKEAATVYADKVTKTVTESISSSLSTLLGIGDAGKNTTTEPFKNITSLLDMKTLSWKISPETNFTKGSATTQQSDLSSIGGILNNSYQTSLKSEEYLASISSGITGLRQEISLLRQEMSGTKKVSTTSTEEVSKVSRSGYYGVGFIGTRRV